MASYRRGWRPGVLFPSWAGRCRRGKPARRSEFFALSRAFDSSPFGSLFVSSTALNPPNPGERAGIPTSRRNTTPRPPRALTSCEPVSLPSQLHSHNGRNWNGARRGDHPRRSSPGLRLFSRGCVSLLSLRDSPREIKTGGGGGQLAGVSKRTAPGRAASSRHRMFCLPCTPRKQLTNSPRRLGGSTKPPSDVPDNDCGET